LQWLRDPSQINMYKLNSVRRDSNTRVEEKTKQLKCKINELQTSHVHKKSHVHKNINRLR